MLIPIFLIVLALAAALATYQGIRRGGARFYTLEREAILRRAAFTLAGTVLFFLGAIALLWLQLQQITAQAAADAGAVIEGIQTSTPIPDIEAVPPTASPTNTPDASLPTATPTPIICRAVIEGTQGNGLLLRQEPGGTEIVTLPEGTLITMVPDESPQTANGLIWRKVRSVVSSQEGWVAQDYLSIEPGCQ